MPIAVETLTALGALIVALLAWLKARDVERLRHELIEREARLREDLVRETRSQESRLRVKEETRLRMFTDATRGAEQVERELVVAADEVVTAVSELMLDESDAALARIRALTESYARGYSGAGLFLPPELDTPAQATRDAIRRAAGEVKRLARRDDPLEHDDSDEILTPMLASLTKFRDAASAWKRTYWNAWAED
jgi:hypothetical protein